MWSTLPPPLQVILGRNRLTIDKGILINFPVEQRIMEPGFYEILSQGFAFPYCVTNHLREQHSVLTDSEGYRFEQHIRNVSSSLCSTQIFF